MKDFEPDLNQQPTEAAPDSILHDHRAALIVRRRLSSAITQALFLAGDRDSQVALDETMETEVWDAIRDPQIAAALVRIGSHGVMLREQRTNSQLKDDHANHD